MWCLFLIFGTVLEFLVSNKESKDCTELRGRLGPVLREIASRLDAGARNLWPIAQLRRKKLHYNQSG